KDEFLHGEGQFHGAIISDISVMTEISEIRARTSGTLRRAGKGEMVRLGRDDHPGNTRFNRWKRRKRRVRLGLVPVAAGVEVVCAVVGVAVFDGDLDGFFEGDEAFGVPAVEAIAATGALGVDDEGRALTHVGEGVSVEVPRAVVVILSAGAVDGGLGIAV